MSRVRKFVLGGVCCVLLVSGYGAGAAPLSVAADATPAVNSVTPAAGPSAGGTPIVIDGSGFTGATDVLIGTSDVPFCPATPSCFTVPSDTEIDLTTPSNPAGTSDVQVRSPAGTSPKNGPGDYFTYLDQPTVTNVASPASEGATGITVTGTGFAIPGPPATSAVTEVDLVSTFGGPTVALTAQCTTTGQPDCFGFTDDTHMPIDLPSSSILPGQYDTVVITPVGTSTRSSKDQVVVQQPVPTVTSVSPNSGSESGGPPTVTIGGTDFTGSGFTTSGVSFGGTAATTFSVTDATTITATPPAGSGQADIIVTTQSTDGNSTQASATTNADTYAYAPTPTVTNVTPGTGPTGGGNTVTLTGTGFKSSYGPGANFNATVVTVDATDITTTPCSGPPSSPCFNVTSATQITVEDFPPHGAGTVDITVTTPGGTSSTGPGDEYVYAVLPTVTGVAPAAGPPSGGDTVVVTGTGFIGATHVFVDTHGSTPCPGSPTGPCFTVNSATQITVQNLPAHAPATVDITVQAPAGTSAMSSADQYTYASAPAVTGVSPSFGPLGGGGSVIVDGTGFDPAGMPATGVSVGTSSILPCPGSPCFTVESDSQLTIASFPSGAAATVHITVTTVGGTSATSSADQYTYVPPPSVTGVTPPTGPTGGGNSVTVTGTTFESAGEYTTTSVLVGTHNITSAPCPGTPTIPCFTINSATSITIGDLPAHVAGAVDITVTTNEGTSAISQPADQYTYEPIPAVSAVSPNAGVAAGGNTVTVTGTLFTNVTSVSVGSGNLTTPCPVTPTTPCFVVNSATQISVEDFPAGSGNVDITVTTPGGTSPTSAADVYAYAPIPTITKVAPNHGSINGGTSVTLTGTGFEPTGTNRSFTTTGVSVGGTVIATTPCPGAPTGACYNVNSSTQIFVEDFPPHPAGPVDITVTTIGGISIVSSSDKYIYGAVFPTVTSLSVSAGAEGGGALLTISGANYLSASISVSDIFFGSTDVPASNAFPCPGTTTGCFMVIGPTQINVDTPADTVAGVVDVTVQTNIGTSGTSTADQYTYVASGAYTALTPFRICDTRPGQTHVGCTSARTLGVNGTVVVQITGVVVSGESVPSGAQAVVVNLTAIDHSTTNSFVTAYPLSRPVASNINVDGGRVQANLAVVALSPAGTITVFNAIGSVDVFLDVEGYFATPSGNAGTFHTFSPVRICDTRANQHTVCAATANNPLGAGSWRDVVVSGLPPGGTGVGIPNDGTAAAAVFNLTAVNPSAATFLAVAPALANHTCPAGHPTVSNLNPAASETEPNRVISPLGPNQDICVYNSVGSTNFFVDVNGWFGTGAEMTSGTHFYAVPPTRICDTRARSGTQCVPTPTAAVVRTIPVAGVKVTPAIDGAVAPVAVIVNITGVTATANTYLELYPSDAPRPVASDLNPAAKDVVADLDIVALATTGAANGHVNLYNSAGAINIILDVAGWFQ